jgi:chromosome segregation ATPase
MLDKFKEKLHKIIHPKQYCTMHVDTFKENIRCWDKCQFKIERLESQKKSLQKRYDKALEEIVKLTDENKKLQKRIDELENDQQRWDLLDL